MVTLSAVAPLSDEDLEDRRVRTDCKRRLSGHHPVPMDARLNQLAAMPEAAGPQDTYGSGGPVPALERRVADLLGKPEARFVIKGVIAQQAALRAWAETRNRLAVALHPASHIATDENGAFEQLHPLRGIRIGGSDHFTTEQLDGIGDQLGAVTIELPLTRAGYRLPEWETLIALSEWCRDRRVPFHLDGARLWEAAPFYAQPLAGIAALFDSVYVSFYKGLGGLGGCVLAGQPDFLKTANPWLSRHGAPLWTVYPYVLSALHGLDTQLPRMAEYRDRATALAAALDGIDGVIVETPKTNAFAIHLRGRHAEFRSRHRDLAERTSVWLLGYFSASDLVGYSLAEIQIGESAAHLADAEVRSLLTELVSPSAG